jgi:Fur family ferric uptake transcriptional regulator
VKKVQRKTTQRQAILDAFQDSAGPIGPTDILRLAGRLAPGLGIATVYRSLNALVDDGKIVPVQIAGEPTRYEVVGKKHHHHFRCRCCQQVFEIEGCPGHLEMLVPKGFSMEDHEVVLYGLCASCSTPPAKTRTMTSKAAGARNKR